MSSFEHLTTSPSNLQLIINALGDYANLTGIDLSKNPFAEKFQLSTASDSILELLRERETAFKEYRDGNRKLMNTLNPAVRVLHAFSSILNGAVGLGGFVSDETSGSAEIMRNCGWQSFSDGTRRYLHNLATHESSRVQRRIMMRRPAYRPRVFIVLNPFACSIFKGYDHNSLKA
ncbi:hypothetical protein BC826DRAFT_972667 [Russula brevipes]|nr:hypothetical protein BC826DRAFT_972667 [Russula brevipes]